MDLWEDIFSWQPLSRIENASQSLYQSRIEKAYHVEIPNKIEPIPYVGKEAVVEYKTSELVAKCPVTFLPDFYTLTIRYVPDMVISELRSLKFYLGYYANLPISHEHLASKIYRDFDKVVSPNGLYIVLEVNVRGGIKTTVEVGDEI